jgi:hypothetical protein
MAATGQGEDEPKPDEAERARLRGRALGWLEAEIAAWTKYLEGAPPQARPAVARVLGHWKEDADLASARDPEALAMLPAPEREKWQALWANVDKLLEKAIKAP